MDSFFRGIGFGHVQATPHYIISCLLHGKCPRASFLPYFTGIASAFYYLAICIVVFFTGIIIFKLIFWPPCTIVGKNCEVDGWSIAGLAGTVLAVSATMLAILGTIAVATFWFGLDTRVKKQVDESLTNQEDKMNNKVDVILSKQENKVKQTFDRLEERNMNLDKQINEIQKQYETIQQISLDAAMINPPWFLENWASKMVHEYKMLKIAALMVFKYLDYVEGFFSSDPSELMAYSTRLAEINAPSSNPHYYWEAALSWQKMAVENPLLESNLLKQINDKVNVYKPMMDEWTRIHRL